MCPAPRVLNFQEKVIPWDCDKKEAIEKALLLSQGTEAS